MGRASRTRFVHASAAAIALTAGCAGLLPRPAVSPRARAAILFVGDGMGLAAYTATRLWKVGATGRLATDSLPHTALVTTHTAEDIVADSAAAATALLTGVRAKNFALSWEERAGPGGSAGECAVPTLCEIASQHGFAVGIELGSIQVTMRIDQPHFRRAPTGTSSRKPTSTGGVSSSEAATIMPWDSMPRSLRGCKLATITTLRPINCSG